MSASCCVAPYNNVSGCWASASCCVAGASALLGERGLGERGVGGWGLGERYRLASFSSSMPVTQRDVSSITVPTTLTSIFMRGNAGKKPCSALNFLCACSIALGLYLVKGFGDNYNSAVSFRIVL